MEQSTLSFGLRGVVSRVSSNAPATAGRCMFHRGGGRGGVPVVSRGIHLVPAEAGDQTMREPVRRDRAGVCVAQATSAVHPTDCPPQSFTESRWPAYRPDAHDGPVAGCGRPPTAASHSGGPSRIGLGHRAGGGPRPHRRGPGRTRPDAGAGGGPDPPRIAALALRSEHRARGMLNNSNGNVWWSRCTTSSSPSRCRAIRSRSPATKAYGHSRSHQICMARTRAGGRPIAVTGSRTRLGGFVGPP